MVRGSEDASRIGDLSSVVEVCEASVPALGSTIGDRTVKVGTCVGRNIPIKMAHPAIDRVVSASSDLSDRGDGEARIEKMASN